MRRRAGSNPWSDVLAVFDLPPRWLGHRCRRRLLGALILSALGAAGGACTSGEAFLPTSPTAGSGGSGGASVPDGGGAAGTGGSGAVGSGGATGSLVPGTGGRSGTGGAPAAQLETGGAAGNAAGTGGLASSSSGAAGSSPSPGAGGGSQPGSGTILLGDDFEDRSTKGWLQDPSDTTGMWAVTTDPAGSKALTESVATSSISWMVGGDARWTNQRVEAKVTFTSFTDSGATAFVATRFVDFDDYYFVQMKVDGSLKIRKRIKGSTSDLVTYKSKVAVVAGDTHTFGMSFADTTLVVYLDGVAVATGTEAVVSNPAGGIALGTEKLVASFDDVEVTVP